jgi:hypothetical protein
MITFDIVVRAMAIEIGNIPPANHPWCKPSRHEIIYDPIPEVLAVFDDSSNIENLLELF